MKFDLPAEDMRRAKAPHELFLTNLVGNHILWFVSALGIFNTYWQPLLLVPILSVAAISYSIWRAGHSRKNDEWFEMVQWQIVAKRSKIFALIMLAGCVVAALGWVGYTYLGMMKVAVIATVGGIGLLPVMVSVLVLIVMESDAMHQGSSGVMSNGIFERFPNDDVIILEDSRLDNSVEGEKSESNNAQAS
ncbi:MAG: hypothetical protein V7739_16995 [Motiliproteus sp.]